MQTENTGVGGAVATEETDRLIASDKVEGTAVYNRQSERLGTVYNLMIDKYTGQVAYAVMSFGGFLGMGESYSSFALESADLRHSPRRTRRRSRPQPARRRAELYVEQPA
jgi:PRC-barrel domain protein